MNTKPYSPSILVVDDDEAITGYLRKNFHNETSVGVLVANRLRDAKNLIDNPSVMIDAVVADIFFAEGTNDTASNLVDGIDVLAYCHQKRPSVSKYVFSVWSERDEERRKAEEAKIGVKEWFHKMFYNRDDVEKTPWAAIERDLIKDHLRREPAMKTHIDREGPNSPDSLDRVSEHASYLRRPVRTYIQAVPHDRYEVRRPIEVVCIQEEDQTICAHALQIGLFAMGSGDTVQDAVDDLAAILVDQAEAFDSESADSLQGYAKRVKSQLDTFIAAREGRK